jgi:Na+/proline symporter
LRSFVFVASAAAAISPLNRSIEGYDPDHYMDMAVAVAAQGMDSALSGGLAALSYASGPIVGAFLLGVLTRSATSAGTMTGMIIGLAVSLAVGRLAAPTILGWPGVAWTWNVAIGAIVTAAVGLLVSKVMANDNGTQRTQS